MTKNIHIPHNIGMLAMSAVLTAGLYSCEYKDLEDGSVLNPVTINFDFNAVDSFPNAMRVAFYPVDDLARANMTKGYTLFDLPKTIWPAQVQLPAGIYDVVAWNNDTEHVLTDKYGNSSLQLSWVIRHAYCS